DSKQVAGQRAAVRIVAAIRAQQRQKDLLRHVLRQRLGAAHVQGEPKQSRLPPTVERQERLFVATLHANQEFVVRLRGGCRHGPFTHYSAQEFNKFQIFQICVKLTQGFTLG